MWDGKEGMAAAMDNGMRRRSAAIEGFRGRRRLSRRDFEHMGFSAFGENPQPGDGVAFYRLISG